MSWWRRKPRPATPPVAGETRRPVLEEAGQEGDVTPEPETAELTAPGTELRKGDQVKVVTTPEQEAQARWDGWK